MRFVIYSLIFVGLSGCTHLQAQRAPSLDLARYSSDTGQFYGLTADGKYYIVDQSRLDEYVLIHGSSMENYINYCGLKGRR